MRDCFEHMFNYHLNDRSSKPIILVTNEDEDNAWLFFTP